jgi:hypothetical protein
MSFTEKVKKAIRGKLEKSNVSPIIVFGKRGLDEDSILDLQTGEFYKDEAAKESKWPCPHCHLKTLEERPQDNGRFFCRSCGGIFDRDLVVGNKVIKTF